MNAGPLFTKMGEATSQLNGTNVGALVGQVSQADKDALELAITAAQNVYDNRQTKTQQQLDTATSALQAALTTFLDKVIQAGDASTLATSISNTTTIHANAVEGIAVGQYIVGSKAVLKTAIDTAQLVLNDAANKTQQQLNDAKVALDQAITEFTNRTVTVLIGLENVTVTETATNSSNQVTLGSDESLALETSSATIATVSENPTGTIQVTGVTVGGPITITVQVKKDGQVIKTGTFTVTTTAVTPPVTITSKTLTNLDFSTVQATQAKLVSKPVTVGDFTGNRKDFTIKINGDDIPIYVSWKLSTDFPKGAAMGSVVESHIQQYYIDKGGSTALMNRPIAAFGFDDTFQVSAFQPGATSSFELVGSDWSYFFTQSIAQGTDTDTSKNKSFTIDDGTTVATIQLTTHFVTMDDLVSRINNRLTTAGVKVQAQKVSATQFKLTSTVPGGDVIIDGIDKATFF